MHEDFMIAFAVSDVSPTNGHLPFTTLEESLRARSQRASEAAVCNLTNLIESSAHGFIAAIHIAFDWHHPLVLSPVDLWLCLAQGFATHVRLHAGALRGRFVSHKDRDTLSVRRDQFC
jgi:hypothetical protein